MRTDSILIDLVAGLALVEYGFASIGICGHGDGRQRSDHCDRDDPFEHLSSFPICLQAMFLERF
jgi:hypothetical protein